MTVLLRADQFRPNSGHLGYYPLVTGETAGDIDNYAYPPGHAFRYGITNAGVLTRTKIDRLITAINASGSLVKDVVFPPGTYNVGNLGAGEEAFAPLNVTDLKVTAYGALFTCNTTASGIGKIFIWKDCERITWLGGRGTDTGYDKTLTWYGATFHHLYNQTVASGKLSGYKFLGVRADNMVSALSASGLAGARLTDIEFDLYLYNCYYGPNFQNQGDDVRGYAYLWNARRAYFPYGIKNHDVVIRCEGDNTGAGSNSAVPIDRTRSAGSLDTKNVRLRISFGGYVPSWGTLVRLEHQGSSAAAGTEIIDDIDLTINVDADATMPTGYAVEFVDENLSAVPYATTAAKWDRIRIAGNYCNTGGVLLGFSSVQATEGQLTLDSDARPASQSFPHYPGFKVKLAHNVERRTIKGNLTTQTAIIDLAGLDSNPFTLKVTIVARDAGLSGRNCTYREDILDGYNAGGGGIAFTATNLHAISSGTPPTIVYTAVGETIVVSFTGAGFTGSSCFAVVDVAYDKYPKRV